MGKNVKRIGKKSIRIKPYLIGFDRVTQYVFNSSQGEHTYGGRLLISPHAVLTAKAMAYLEMLNIRICTPFYEHRIKVVNRFLRGRF